MSRKKLTLSVEERLMKRAKAIAETRGTSVSRLVDTFFTTLKGHEEEAPEDEGTGPDAHNGDESSTFDDYTRAGWAVRWQGAFGKGGGNVSR